MSHSTVCHRWFHQIGNKKTKENAYESGNVFYRNKVIYSYGRHFALAIRFDDFILINSKGYSVSTSKHKGHVLNSIDTSTHNEISVPLKEAYSFDDNVNQKDVFKYIDFGYFVRDFNLNLKRLGNARKPEIYLRNIKRTQECLSNIFATFRGSKTYALKTKGMRQIINFVFTDELKAKMKKARLVELANDKARREAYKKTAIKNLIEFEQGAKNFVSYDALKVLGLNTVIRAKGGGIETSKGAKIDINMAVKIFGLWEAGMALGNEVVSSVGTFKCTKADELIKFGCHEIHYNQAKRVLSPFINR